MYYNTEEKQQNSLKWEKINLHKQLIQLSKELTIDDWRRIRSGNYYQIRDSYIKNLNDKKTFLKLDNNLLYDELGQMYFIISRIKKYLNL
jgi:hypothetical protein